ncbi:dienelactone hydrolase family protein [Azohydromonas australica]|uniref:dienelactone hydrolase family protein n=1 Tax=Azohydromonas australica TaxID=364039 RepID=UPI00049119F9|nr:dienelactone hydrolase family protein [Azohydromonas australica]
MASVQSLVDEGYIERSFRLGQRTQPVFDKGSGPPVLVLHELPGLTKPCLNFAERLISAGFHVHLPLLVGRPLERAPHANYRKLCISEEFARLEAGKHAPVTDALRTLAQDISQRHGGRRIGAIGMCLTGAFVIPLVIDPCVAAAIASQPAIPMHLGYLFTGLGGGRWMDALNISDSELQHAADVARSDGKHIIVQRFSADRLCPGRRVRRIASTFGDTAILHEYPESSWWRRTVQPPHALLTEEYDANEDAAHPTRLALQRVVDFLRQHLT